MIFSILNNTKRAFVGNYSPITTLSVLDPDITLCNIVRQEIRNQTNFNEISAMSIAQAENFIKALDWTHRGVSTRHIKAEEAFL